MNADTVAKRVRVVHLGHDEDCLFTNISPKDAVIKAYIEDGGDPDNYLVVVGSMSVTCHGWGALTFECERWTEF